MPELFEENFYEHERSANGAARLSSCRCMKDKGISFFNYLITQNLSDTSNYTNKIFANLNNANLLKKRICRSISRAIQKQNKTSSYFKLNGRPS